MPRNFEVPTPIRIDKLTRLFRVRGVDVFVHWTVFLIAGIMIAATIRQPWVTLAAGASWLALILLHECGHMGRGASQKVLCFGHLSLSDSRTLLLQPTLVAIG